MSNQFYLAFKESKYPVLEVCQRMPFCNLLQEDVERGGRWTHNCVDYSCRIWGASENPQSPSLIICHANSQLAALSSEGYSGFINLL